ncbi:MAG TPA: YfiR family protein [Sphingopyxis sp.]|uniref:YfiR family protein n=1 Tax=Sphingopyxis sp. TaxID=1908224 RepID=UPI002E35476D|nr:YfiR family protein [Sphingopyxis sp.]HEX2811442.1 YfiR family protein [Sphingopyxis sp.]
MLVSLLLIGSSLTTPQMAVQAASQTIVENSAEGVTNGVNRILGGIISYARWPASSPGTPHGLCLVGAPRLTGRIAPIVPGGQAVAVRRTTAAGATSGGCDIIFLGHMPIADRQRLIGWVRGRPVLTITDDDPDCSFGAMFCLNGGRSKISFSVNLDAIGRGPLRIDPRVLKIGSDDGEAR